MATKSWDTPPSLWMNGKLVPWKDCQIHVTSAYAQRGASIFEGIRVYKTTKLQAHFALAIKEHLLRLDNSWRTLSLPTSYTTDLVRPALHDLLDEREIGDCYCRVTRFLDSVNPDTGIEPDGLMVALYKSEQLLGRPVRCVTSSWRRDEFALPAQMKIGGHYFLLSWVRQEARRLGADDAILINRNDFVSEASGTAVFIFKNGSLVTPPISDGALPSITVQILTKLAKQLGISVLAQSIHRTELFLAEAAFLAGTLDELRPVTAVDGVALPNALNCEKVRTLFEAFSVLCRTEHDSDWGDLIVSK